MANNELELLIRKNTLKDVELWLYQQYVEIEKELLQLVKDRNDDSAGLEGNNKEEKGDGNE